MGDGDAGHGYLLLPERLTGGASYNAAAGKGTVLDRPTRAAGNVAVAAGMPAGSGCTRLSGLVVFMQGLQHLYERRPVGGEQLLRAGDIRFSLFFWKGGVMAVTPIIFVHGIQGSWLKNEYPVDYDNQKLWTGIPLLGRKYAKLPLSDVDSEVDAAVERFIFPHQAVPLAYESIVDELREEVTPYTYVFTYDWRKDNRVAAGMLGQFVDLVLKTVTAHEKKKAKPAPKQVVLVGHSMGGLVIKWYATRVLKPGTAGGRIAKIITIATPYKGSLKAVEALLPGARNLFGMEHQKHMRHGARTMPGLYQLLPTWEGAVVDKHTTKPLDIFKAGSWQSSLVHKMAETHGSRYFQRMLSNTRTFMDVMAQPYPASLRRKLYVVYGTGSSTWRKVEVDSRKGNFYDFKNAVEEKTGDGTVHSISSIVDGVTRNRTYVDLKQAMQDMILGQHANMPNHGVVQDWVLKVLNANPHFAGTFESPM